tara:strand:- start:44993 stop:45172 length:180 start_codon:yes stop_codon:yes gene_type:complete
MFDMLVELAHAFASIALYAVFGIAAIYWALKLGRVVHADYKEMMRKKVKVSFPKDEEKK